MGYRPLLRRLRELPLACATRGMGFRRGHDRGAADASSDFGDDRMSFPRHMMATKATHALGDISRDEPDLCVIEREEQHDYVGAWVTGFGFINVRFPKETTRDLTEAEIRLYDGKRVRIGSQPAIPIKIRGCLGRCASRRWGAGRSRG